MLTVQCEEKADIVFLIDSSGSVQETSAENWRLILTLIGGIVNRLPVSRDEIRIGALEFSSDVIADSLLFLNNDLNKADLEREIGSMHHYGGNTNTAAALRVCRERMFHESKGHRPGERSIAILLTDGISNVHANATSSEARALKQAGVQVFTVGITKYTNIDELQEIASDPVEYHQFLAQTYAGLDLLLDRLLVRLCTLKPPETSCTELRGDLVFMLDASGSIGEKNPENEPELYNWNLLQDFVVSVVERLTIATNMTRVAVIRYADAAAVIFLLNRFNRAGDVIDEVKKLKYVKGKTNIAGALQTARTEVFTQARGDRPGVRNIGIIITDGEATVDANNTLPEAELVKQDGVRMFAIGITEFVQRSELEAIASDPVEDHVMYVSQFGQVEELTSRLIWKICNDVEGRPAVCDDGKPPTWLEESEHLLVGHNYARLPDVTSADECKRLCLQDSKCRSIEYVTSTRECAVSYSVRSSARDSFVPDPNVDYYEWRCTGDSSGNPNTPVDDGPEVTKKSDENQKDNSQRTKPAQRATTVLPSTDAGTSLPALSPWCWLTLTALPYSLLYH
ncbi:Collagen alpha-6(VI) chain [Lamellibrachia satsuma]|nr:Collagen alpha-6(VI) chain [Lamellibrachia satsuma]